MDSTETSPFGVDWKWTGGGLKFAHLASESFKKHDFHSCYLIHECSEVRCIAEWDIWKVRVGNGVLAIEVYSVHKARSISNCVDQLVGLANRCDGIIQNLRKALVFVQPDYTVFDGSFGIFAMFVTRQRQRQKKCKTAYNFYAFAIIMHRQQCSCLYSASSL